MAAATVRTTRPRSVSSAYRFFLFFYGWSIFLILSLFRLLAPPCSHCSEDKNETERERERERERRREQRRVSVRQRVGLLGTGPFQAHFFVVNLLGSVRVSQFR